MTPDTGRLRELAKAATQGARTVTGDTGHWSATYDGRGNSCYQAIKADGTVVALAVARGSLSSRPDSGPDADLIAAMDPATVTALCDAADRAVRLEKMLAIVLDVHATRERIAEIRERFGVEALK